MTTSKASGQLPDHVIVGDSYTHETADVKVGALYRVASMQEIPLEPADHVALTEFTLHPFTGPPASEIARLREAVAAVLFAYDRRVSYPNQFAQALKNLRYTIHGGENNKPASGYTWDLRPATQPQGGQDA